MLILFALTGHSHRIVTCHHSAQKPLRRSLLVSICSWWTFMLMM